MARGHFDKIKEDVPVVMEYRKVRGDSVANMNLACCDCGLVHNIAFVPLKTRLKAYFWRDNRRTANRRRGKEFKEKSNDIYRNFAKIFVCAVE